MLLSVAWQVSPPGAPKSGAPVTPGTTASREPGAPEPSGDVRRLLAEALRLFQEKQFAQALQAGDRALATARSAEDPPGIARAQALRARALESDGRAEEAVATWREAAAAWEAAGDGPGVVEALAAAAGLRAPKRPAEAETLIAQAVELGRRERKRPLQPRHWRKPASPAMGVGGRHRRAPCGREHSSCGSSTALPPLSWR
jgi:hypothetical protein